MKITVVTYVLNDVLHIEQTILSVLNQDYADLEYIVIDGGSTDGTKEVICQFADRFSYWISEPEDGGIFAALNKGLKIATGEWVNFMSSGSVFANCHVLTDIFGDCGILSAYNTQNISLPWIIGGDTIRVFQNGEEISKAEPADSIPYQVPFPLQSCFVRIKPETFCFGQQYKYSADYKFFYDLYFAYGKSVFLVVDCIIAKVTQGESVQSTSDSQKKVRAEILKIQSACRSWKWWKAYIKFKLIP